MGKIKEKLTVLQPTTWQGWLSVLWFFVLAAVHVYLMRGHSFWRDELEAWVTVAGMGGFWESLFVPMHPPLWYILLYAAHKIWPDPQMLVILGSVIALGCFALLMAMTRISLLLRVLISLNFYFLWQYTVVVRGYGLALLLLLLWLSLRDEKQGQRHWQAMQMVHGVVLALFALVHIYAIALTPLLYVWRYGFSFSPWRVIPAGTGCIVSAFLVWWSYPHMISPAISGVSEGGASQAIAVALTILKPLFLTLAVTLSDHLLLLLGGVFLVSLTWLFYRSYRQTVAGGNQIFWLFRVASVPVGLSALAVGLVLGSAALWHMGFIWLAVVALLCLCQQQTSDKSIHKIIYICALCMSLFTVPLLMESVSKIYSAANLAAQQIKKMELDTQPWIAMPSWAGTAPFAYLQRPYFALETMRFITYTDWRSYWQREQHLGKDSMSDRVAKLCLYARENRVNYVNLLAPYNLFKSQIEPQMLRLGLTIKLRWKSPDVLATDEDVSLFSVDVSGCYSNSEHGVKL